MSASSEAPGRDCIYASDDVPFTWWQPSPDDKEPTLTIQISKYGTIEINAVRIWWRDVGFNIKNGVFPGPFGFKVEARLLDGEWECVLDKSDNNVDMNIDYFVIESRKVNEVRLIITSKPEGIEPGVINFTVFGARPSF